MGEENNITMPPKQMNRSRIDGKKRTRKKMTTSTTIEFQKHPCNGRIERSCWKINNEKNKLVVGLWKNIPKPEVKSCH